MSFGDPMTTDGAAYFASERLRWSERDFQEAVTGMAEGYGYITYHTFDSRRSDAGFPDIVAVRPGRIVYIELKAMQGRLSDAQREWLAALNAGGGEVFVFRPCCWNSGELENVLRGER